MIEAGPLAGVQYGWTCDTPKVDDTEKLQRLVHRTLELPLVAPKALKLLLQGHRSDIRYRCQQEAILGVVRAIHKGLSQYDPSAVLPWRARGGWSGTLTRHLQWTGWTAAAEPWVWQHAGADATITLRQSHRDWKPPGRVGHLLREAWRHHMYSAFMRGERRSTIACAGVQYDPKRYKITLDLARKIPAGWRILAGAVVSPAHLHRGDPVRRQCPWCRRALGTLDHITWECTDDAFSARPRHEPHDGLQRRLLWPTAVGARKNIDEELPQWGIFVDATIREHRYGEGGYKSRPRRRNRHRGL